VQIGVALAVIAAAVLVVALVPQLRHSVGLVFSGDFHGLRSQIRSLGFGGVVLLIALMLAHAVLFYPTEIVSATAGFVYGFFAAAPLLIAGWLVSGLLAYLLGRVLGRPLLNAVFGERRFDGLERAVKRGGVPLLLGARLVPIVPFSLTGYVAGAARVSVWRFSWTTVVGYLPLTLAVCYLGSRAESLSLDSPLVWVAIVVIMALLVTSRLLTKGGRDPIGQAKTGSDPD
jgi:uncharacterized membrane protein YdjX (TVP38/TMEM64 family)